MTDTLTGMAGTSERAASQRWPWILTFLVTFVVLGSAGVVIFLDAQQNDRGEVRSVAEQYIAAIADGDSEAASDLSVLESGVSDVALSPEVFSRAHHITQPQLHDLRVDFDRGTAQATVDYQLAGAFQSDHLTLVRGASDEWAVTDGLREILTTDPEGLDAVAFAGMEEAFSYDVDSAVYVGSYEVVSTSDLFEAKQDLRFDVTGSDPWLYDADWLTPTAELDRLVQAEVVHWYEKCATRTTVTELRNCGIEISDSGLQIVSDVRADVKMTEAPTIETYGYPISATVLESTGSFTVEFSGRDSKGKAVTEKSVGRASEADIEVYLDGAADNPKVTVEVYSY